MKQHLYDLCGHTGEIEGMPASRYCPVCREKPDSGAIPRGLFAGRGNKSTWVGPGKGATVEELIAWLGGDPPPRLHDPRRTALEIIGPEPTPYDRRRAEEALARMTPAIR